jgi:hypothetical protein
MLGLICPLMLQLGFIGAMLVETTDLDVGELME